MQGQVDEEASSPVLLGLHQNGLAVLVYHDRIDDAQTHDLAGCCLHPFPQAVKTQGQGVKKLITNAYTQYASGNWVGL